MKNPFANTNFIKSASSVSSFPPDEGKEISFVGISNAGKSSAINRICQSKKLTKVSKTPGRTGLINFFSINPDMRLVDMPGLGYARVSKKQKIEWQKLITNYLTVRKSLLGLVLLVDCRHPDKLINLNIIQWAILNNIKLLILFTKADKISGNNLTKNIKILESALNLCPSFKPHIIPFSAESCQGLDHTIETLSLWLDI